MSQHKKLYGRDHQYVIVWTGQPIEYYLEYTASSRHPAIKYNLEYEKRKSILDQLWIALTPDHRYSCSLTGQPHTSPCDDCMSFSIVRYDNRKSASQCRCTGVEVHPASTIDTRNNYCRAYYFYKNDILMKTKLPFTEFAITYLRCTRSRDRRHDDSDDDVMTHAGDDDEITGYIHHTKSELCICCNTTFTRVRVCEYCEHYMRGYIRAIHLIHVLVSPLQKDIASMMLAILMLI